MVRKQLIAERPSPLNFRSLWGLLFVVSLVWSLRSAGVLQGDLINEGGWTLVWRFLVAATHPDLSPELLQLTLESTLKTLAFAVCGTFFCILIGLVGGVLSSEVWWQSVSGISRDVPPERLYESSSLGGNKGGFGNSQSDSRTDLGIVFRQYLWTRSTGCGFGDRNSLWCHYRQSLL